MSATKRLQELREASDRLELVAPGQLTPKDFRLLNESMLSGEFSAMLDDDSEEIQNQKVSLPKWEDFASHDSSLTSVLAKQSVRSQQKRALFDNVAPVSKTTSNEDLDFAITRLSTPMFLAALSSVGFKEKVLPLLERGELDKLYELDKNFPPPPRTLGFLDGFAYDWVLTARAFHALTVDEQNIVKKADIYARFVANVSKQTVDKLFALLTERKPSSIRTEIKRRTQSANGRVRANR